MKQYRYILLLITFACLNSEKLKDACTRQRCTGAGWDTNIESTEITSTCGNYQLIGGFNKASKKAWFQKVFRLKEEHTWVTLTLTAFILDSWDNEYFTVFVNGMRQIHEKFLIHDFKNKLCGNTGYNDDKVVFQRSFKHTDKNLILTVNSTLDEQHNNESFGFNDIKIDTCTQTFGTCGFNQQNNVEPCKQALCNDVTGWTSNYPFDFKGQCGEDKIIGGYKIAGKDIYFSKHFFLKKNHNRVTIKLRAYMIDSWDHNEKFIVKADEQVIIEKASPYTDTNISSNNQRCGGHFPDRVENLKYSFNHDFPILHLEITTNLDTDATDESFGFNNVEIITCNTDKQEDCDTKQNYPVYNDFTPKPHICMVKMILTPKLQKACKCFECIKNGTGFYSKAGCSKVLHRLEIQICPLDTYCINTYEGCLKLIPIVKPKNCVIIYSECNYRGRKLKVCKDIKNLKQHRFDKPIKSIKIVDQNTKVQIFDLPNYQGASSTFTDSNDCIDGNHASFLFVQTQSKIITKLVKNNMKK